MRKYRKGIFFVVYRKVNSKILYLILKRKLHWKGWEFPKAGLERGERNKKAVRREMREQTGLKIKKIIGFKEKGKFRYHKKFKDRPGVKGQTWKLFAVEVSKKKVKIDKKEHSDCKWLEYEKALKILTWLSQRKCLREVNKKVKIKLNSTI